MQHQGLYWGKCVWFCTDRAANMAGCHSDATVVANKNLLSTRCIYCCGHIAS